jgi:hypothetical protein
MAPEVQDPKKLVKIVNYQNCQKTVLGQLEKVGGHRYPPGSGFPMIVRKISHTKWVALETHLMNKIRSSFFSFIMEWMFLSSRI